MKTFFVLVVVVCLASDFCDAAKKSKKKSVKKKKNGDYNGEDYGLIGELLGDPSLIKALIPKNLGELFDIAEEIVPGMKDLQAPIEKSWKLLHPVLKVDLAFWQPQATLLKNIFFQDLPDVVEKLTPTLIEIRKALQGDGDISDEQFAKWGKALVKDGRSFAKWVAFLQTLENLVFRKAIDNFIEAPIEEIIKKLEKSGVVDKVGYMDRDIKVICASDKRVLEYGTQEDVGWGTWLDQEDCWHNSQDQKGLDEYTPD